MAFLRLFLLLAAWSAGALAAPVDQPGFAESKKILALPNGQSIAYAEMGNPSGPPLLLIHGFTDNARSWTLLAPYLAQYRLIAMDLRGHGRSDAPPCCYTVSDLSYDAKLLLDRLGIDKASVIGHSLGSIAAQRLAEHWPDRVDKLILISSTASTFAMSKRGGWLWTSIQSLTAPIDPDGAFMRAWYANPNPVDEEFLHYERAESAAVPLVVWQGVLHETAMTEFGRLLPDLSRPTLILAGGKDPLFGENDRRALRRALPRAQFKLFPKLGHNLMWEDPAAAAAAILAFLT